MPLVGQPVAGGQLALGERQAEGAVDAHHLAGRAHLGPEHRVDLGEAVERQHRLLDRDVPAVDRRAQQALVAQLGERGADHHPGRDLGQRHAGGLGDERHRAAGPRVGLDHEHLVVPSTAYCTLMQAAHVERARRWRAV